MPRGKTPLLGIARTGVFYLKKERRLVIGYGLFPFLSFKPYALCNALGKACRVLIQPRKLNNNKHRVLLGVCTGSRVIKGMETFSDSPHGRSAFVMR